MSALASQATTVLGLTTHLYGTFDLSQKSVPLHRLPSSWPAQSLSMAHAQVLVPLWHLLLWQASPVVHELPSSQLAVLLAYTQPALASQFSVVQGLLSVQSTLGSSSWPAQVPPLQVSLAVHLLPSSQGLLLAVYTQPVLGLHESLVHGFKSLHTTEVPVQTVFLHTSP